MFRHKTKLERSAQYFAHVFVLHVTTA